MDPVAESFYANISSMYANSRLQPLALVLTLLMGLVLLAVPKRLATVPILIIMVSLTSLQRLVVAGLDFSMTRVMIIFGWLRVALRRENADWKSTGLDWIVVALAVVQVFFFTLQRQNLSGFVTSLGGAFDLIGFYFLFRVLVRKMEHATTAIYALAVLAVPVAVAMLIEQRTGRNFFSVLGGVPELTAVRGGRLRSQACFAHPILAGSFGASLVPLFVAIWRQSREARRCASIGILAAVIITVASSSSGPLFAFLMGVFGLCMWPFSRHMREIRLLTVLVLFGLALVMKAPVYALIARVPLVSGSTGYYRYMLFDAFIHHFRDWWLVGVQSTWYWGEGLVDVTNQYIRVAVDGGLVSLVAFLMLIAFAYHELGRALRVLRTSDSPAQSVFMWCLGATLFCHVVSFVSVSYFDQIVVSWYLLLAMIASLSQSILSNGEPSRITGQMKPRRMAVSPTTDLAMIP